MLALDHVEKSYPGDVAALRSVTVDIPSRRSGGGGGAVGIGQDHDADDPGHARASHQRRGPDRRTRRRQGLGPRARRSACPPDRFRVPDLPPPGHADRGRQRGDRAAVHGGPAPGAAGRGASRARARRPRPSPHPPAPSALGRRAPAGRDRARSRQATGDHPRRRADRKPRLEVGRGGRGPAARARVRWRHARADHPRSEHRRVLPPAHPDARRRDRRRRAADEHGRRLAAGT